MGKALIAMAAACGLVMALIIFAVIGSEEPPPCAPAGSTPQVDVRALSYPSSTGAALPADVYLLQGAGAGATPARPMLVMVHGGGWFFGDRHEYDGVARQAAEHGYIAITFEYDMAAPRWPREMNDVRAAIAWARTQALQWGGDAGKLATWGTSAGANLAVSVAASGDHAGVQAPAAGAAQLASDPGPAGGGGLSAGQLAVANAIVSAGKGMKVPENGIIVALATAQTESGLRNLANDGTDPRLEPDQKDVSRSLQLPHDGVGHDHGSVNEFQQQYPWWGSLEELMTPAIAAQKFYAKLLMVPGWAQMPVPVAAQTVQQSANPGAYAAAETTARAVYAQTSTAPAIAPSVTVGDPTGGAATPGAGCPGASGGAGGANGPIAVVVNGVTLTLPGQAGVTGTLTFPDQATATAAAAALSYLGASYSWGGGGPGGPSVGIHDGGVADSFGDYAKAGFDCSSLVQYAYAKAGIQISRSTGSQWEGGGAGPHYAYSDALPGDLLYYGSPTHHVAMYLGKVGDRQLMVEAPQSGDVVKVSTVRTGELVGVARPTAKTGKQ